MFTQKGRFLYTVHNEKGENLGIYHLSFLKEKWYNINVKVYGNKTML